MHSVRVMKYHHPPSKCYFFGEGSKFCVALRCSSIMAESSSFICIMICLYYVVVNVSNQLFFTQLRVNV